MQVDQIVSSIAKALPKGLQISKKTVRPPCHFVPGFVEVDAKRVTTGRRAVKFTIVDADSGRAAHVSSNDLDRDEFLHLIKQLPAKGACHRVTFPDSAKVETGHGSVPLTLLSKFSEGKAWFEREGIACNDCDEYRCSDTFQDVRATPLRNVLRFAWECLRHLLPDRHAAPKDELTLLATRDGETLSRIAARISSTSMLAADDAVAAYRQYAVTRTPEVKRRLADFLKKYGIDKYDKEDFTRSASPAQGDWLSANVPIVSSSKGDKTFGRATAKLLRHGTTSVDPDVINTAEVLMAMQALGILKTPQTLFYEPSPRATRRSTPSIKKSPRKSPKKVKRM